MSLALVFSRPKLTEQKPEILLLFYLWNKEALLHVSGLDGSQTFHGLVLALAGLQLLPSSQHAPQQHQPHAEDDFHS